MVEMDVCRPVLILKRMSVYSVVMAATGPNKREGSDSNTQRLATIYIARLDSHMDSSAESHRPELICRSGHRQALHREQLQGLLPR